ncbi:MAG: class I SAM-dependent methyltransferase [Myxococcales bacterium]|nr:class I SAM-dependent methyltransferase [Myxococcales bacterium]
MSLLRPELVEALSHVRTSGKAVAKELLGPTAWGWLRDRSGRASTRSPLSSLDAVMADAQLEFSKSEEAGRQFLSRFEFESEPPGGDPFSPAFRDAQLERYARVSGRARYSIDGEFSGITAESIRARPYPYSTGSAKVVGDYFSLLGFVLRHLNTGPGRSLVEFGPGWGHTTRALVALGVDVTAVEVDPAFCGALSDVRATVVQSDMLSFQPAKTFDSALFFESFHHCADPVAMIGRVRELLAPGGVAYFAAEPITDDFAEPWGLRLDGMSAWSIRKHGWLELGFQTAFFHELLVRNGFDVTRHSDPNVADARLIVATVKR